MSARGETHQPRLLIVGLNTATGEGWGLVSFEHAATGAAQIVPRHSACAELWPGSAEFLSPQRSVQTGFSEGQAVSDCAVAEALERLYRDPDHRRRIALAGFRNATQQQYSWHALANRWDGCLRGVLNQLAPGGGHRPDSMVKAARHRRGRSRGISRLWILTVITYFLSSTVREEPAATCFEPCCRRISVT